MLLPAGKFGQAVLALLILDGDHAPDLQIGGGGGRLRRGDDGFERALGQLLRQKIAVGAMREDEIEGLVPLRRLG